MQRITGFLHLPIGRSSQGKTLLVSSLYSVVYLVVTYFLLSLVVVASTAGVAVGIMIDAVAAMAAVAAAAS